VYLQDYISASGCRTNKQARISWNWIAASFGFRLSLTTKLGYRTCSARRYRGTCWQPGIACACEATPSNVFSVGGSNSVGEEVAWATKSCDGAAVMGPYIMDRTNFSDFAISVGGTNPGLRPSICVGEPQCLSSSLLLTYSRNKGPFVSLPRAKQRAGAYVALCGTSIAPLTHMSGSCSARLAASSRRQTKSLESILLKIESPGRSGRVETTDLETRPELGRLRTWQPSLAAKGSCYGCARNLREGETQSSHLVPSIRFLIVF
jgi:hypothetical protein